MTQQLLLWLLLLVAPSLPGRFQLALPVCLWPPHCSSSLRRQRQQTVRS